MTEADSRQREVRVGESMEFFHIERHDPHYKVGETYFIGRNKNKFLRDFDTDHFNLVTKSGKAWCRKAALQQMKKFLVTNKQNEVSAEIFNNDPIEALRVADETLNKYMLLTRELIFEEVRAEYFPAHPSRHRCLWLVSTDPKALAYWRGTFHNKGRLLRVRATGKTYCANEEYLRVTMQTHSLDWIRENAFRYWAGGSGDHPHTDEVLFEGFIEVVEEVDPATLSQS